MFFIPPEALGYQPPPMFGHFVQPWAAGQHGGQRHISDLNPNSPIYGNNRGSRYTPPPALPRDYVPLEAREIRRQRGMPVISSYGEIRPQQTRARASGQRMDPQAFRAAVMQMIASRLSQQQRPPQVSSDFVEQARRNSTGFRSSYR